MAKSGKILIAEDDLFLQRMYTAKFIKEGLDVVTASDGEKAMAIIKSEPIDLVFLDIIMPKKDGFAVLEEIKADPKLKNIPVVLLTNLGEAEDIKRGRKLGANDYMIKAHFLPSEVIEVARKYLK